MLLPHVMYLLAYMVLFFLRISTQDDNYIDEVKSV